ncbi:MAG: toll/interleukin-1 receptor domain-containing protein, partial [Planctomycetota bacterium]
MTQPIVFVCYSHRDSSDLTDLKRFLDPLVQRGVFALWSDLELKPGFEWEKTIEDVIKEASVAVLLVSQNFLNSAYINGEELPAILQAAEAGKLKIAPLFVGESLAEHEAMTFQTGTSGKPFLLTRWEGLNSPRQPLSKVPENERDAELKPIATKLVKIAKEVVSKPHAKRHPARTDREGRPEVTLHLRIDGNQLHRTFASYYGPILKSTTTEFHALVRSSHEPWHPEELFLALFDSETDCVKLLQQLLERDSQLTPVSLGGARIRLVTDDPRLLSQPWSRAKWQQHNLFEAG